MLTINIPIVYFFLTDMFDLWPCIWFMVKDGSVDYRLALMTSLVAPLTFWRKLFSFLILVFLIFVYDFINKMSFSNLSGSIKCLFFYQRFLEYLAYQQLACIRV